MSSGGIDRGGTRARELAGHILRAANQPLEGLEAPSPFRELIVSAAFVVYGVLGLVGLWLYLGSAITPVFLPLLLLLGPVYLVTSVLVTRQRRDKARPSSAEVARLRAIMKAMFVAVAGLGAVGSSLYGYGIVAGEVTRGLVQIAISVGGSFVVALSILGLELLVLVFGPLGLFFFARRGDRWAKRTGAVLQLDRISVQLACGLTWLCAATWFSRDIFIQALIWGTGVYLIPTAVELWLLRRDPRISYLTLRWHRRIAVLASTAAGLGALATQITAPAVIEPIQPLVAVVIGVLLVRVGAWLAWRLRRPVDPDRVAGGLPVFADFVLYGLLVGAVLFAPPLLWQRTGGSKDDYRRLVIEHIHQEPPELKAAVELFVVSDNQFRALGGRPADTHVQLVDDHASASLRPTALDLLSFATLRRFAEIARRAETRPWWVHLGDFGDLSCVSELRRLEKVIGDFATPLDGSARSRADFAGIARGNHDGFFIGNFMWAPDWDEVCGGDRAPSPTAVKELRRMVDAIDPPPGAQVVDLSGGERFYARAVERPLSRGGITRQLAAVFVDTSDYDRRSYGIAGVAGAISSRQCRRIEAYFDQREIDYVVILQHHPFAALSAPGQRCIERLARRANLLAIVSAHTHLAAMHPCVLEVDGRCVPELVAGSTTDRPQEAAWLRIGEIGGKLALQFTTVGPVDRQRCDAAFDKIVAQPSCEALLGQRDNFSHRSSRGRVRDQQERYAGQLLQCLSAVAGGEVPCLGRLGDRPLENNEINACLGAASETIGQEMVCLSWAASILADTEGVSLGDVIACEPGQACKAGVELPYPPMTCTAYYGGDEPPMCTSGPRR